MTALLAALWLLVGSAVTVLPMESLPDGWTNEYGQMVLQDGRVLNAALGCHGADDIRYYRRSEGMHRADIKRESPSMSFRERIQRAHERHVETEVHELAHAYDCLDDGKLNGSPGHHDHVSDDPYCRSNDSERYACAVAETGRLK